MAKISKKAFEHFKGAYELQCGYIVEDEYYNEVIEPELKKMGNTLLRIEFMYKCLYPNEKPLSRKDYGRTRFTERTIRDKRTNLYQIRTKSENETFQRGMRSLNLQQKTYGIYSWNDLKDTEFAHDYIEKGVIKKDAVKFAKQVGLI